MQSEKIILLAITLSILLVGSSTLYHLAHADVGVNIAIGAGSSAYTECVNSSNCYTPNPLTIQTGETVTWTNTDKMSHTITSGLVGAADSGQLFDSSLVKSGATFSYTFDTAGNYPYYCLVHPWMTGQVNVVGNTIQPTFTASNATVIPPIVVDTPPVVSNSNNTIPQPTISEPVYKIPNWVKGVFIAYGNNQISENDLIQALKFLINSNIIVLG